MTQQYHIVNVQCTPGLFAFDPQKVRQPRIGGLEMSGLEIWL